jgi:chemotaxis protein CheD
VTTLDALSSAPDRIAPPRTVAVPMGRMGVARAGEMLTTVGLGSCIAIILFAPEQRLAALAHCMLPARAADDVAFAKFVDSAVPALLASLRDEGARHPFASALVGGASMFPSVPSAFVSDIAGSNIRAARASLAAASIPLRVEDVGGSVGRSVAVDPATQRVMVRTIRDGERWL